MSRIEAVGEISPCTCDSLEPRPRLRMWTKAWLLLASSVFTLLAGELIVRLAFVTDHIEYVTDEDLLWRNRPNQVVRLEGARPGQKLRVITTDERGFRRTVPTPSAGARRVLALGDSAMFGWLLDDRETFCSRLQALSGGKLDIINTAVPGWGLFQEEIVMSRLLETVRPEIVLVHYQECDVTRQPFPLEEQQRYHTFLWESRLRNTIRHYSKLGSLIGHLAMKVVLNRSGRGLLNEVVDVDDDNKDGPSSAFRRCWEAERKRLVAMKAAAERHGAKFVLIYGTWRRSRNTPFFESAMAALVREHAIFHVEMTERLSPYDLQEAHVDAQGWPSVAAVEPVGRPGDLSHTRRGRYDRRRSSNVQVG